MVSCDGGTRIEEQSTLPGHLHLRTTYMLLLEEKLAVEVAHFNGVQVNLQWMERCQIIGPQRDGHHVIFSPPQCL